MPFFSMNPSKKKPTRICFAAVMYGSDRTFCIFFNAGKFYDVDIQSPRSGENGFN
jgi:hypothetical protein